MKKLLALIAAQPANSPAQIAMLTGASGLTKVKGKNPPKVKLLYLDSEAPELASAHGKS